MPTRVDLAATPDPREEQALAVLQQLRPHLDAATREQVRTDPVGQRPRGVQRYDTHRFYLRERMSITSHHFTRNA